MFNLALQKPIKKIFIGFFIFIFVLNSFPLTVLAEGEVTETLSQLEKDIAAINNKIKEQQNKVTALNEKIEAYKKAISQKQKEKKTLRDEIDYFDLEIKKAESQVEALAAQMDEINLEIQNTTFQILEKELILKKKKSQLAALVKEVDVNDRQSLFETLILNRSFSEFLNRVNAIENTQNSIYSSLSTVKKEKEILLDKQERLQSSVNDLSKLKEELDRQKAQLTEKQEIKEYLVVKTEKSEKEFQKLLELSRKEQLAINSELASLENTVRDKIKKKELLGLSRDGFIWPIDPGNGITAYFHDEDYPYRKILEHSGVDIRAKQGTPVHASADGYVARVKSPQESGKGLSYIFLIHGDEISTAYLHLSATYVKEDTYVRKGDVIGLSGGTPGTKGAGNLTTGAHLHFEVRKDGIPVNPMNYLP